MTEPLAELLRQYDRAAGAGVTVAIIDSGIEAAHEALGGAPVESLAVLERDGQLRVEESEPLDVAGHGTACAGQVLSIAPRASLLSLRVLNRNVRTTSRALLQALSYLLNRPDVGVINLSLGTPRRDMALEMGTLVDAFYARGVPIVVSSGPSAVPDYPGCFASPISVASAEGELPPEKLLFYPGKLIEFGARGHDVEVPWRDGEWRIMDGSSFAAPLVAGRLARFKELDPGLRVWELKTLAQAQAGKAVIRCP